MQGVGPSANGYQAALLGIQRGQEGLSQAARETLESGADPGAVVEMKLARAQLEASAKVARVLDESMGTLIDTLA